MGTSSFERAHRALYRDVKSAWIKSDAPVDRYEHVRYRYRITNTGNKNFGHILVTSGIHSDERNITIDPSIAYLAASYGDQMPLITHVELCNPSWLRTTYGTNLNRCFFPEYTLHAACVGMMRAIDTVADGSIFDLGVEMHGDYGAIQEDGTNSMHERYYVYDTKKQCPQLQRAGGILKRYGIVPFSGIDDLNDPILGNFIHDGYVPGPDKAEYDGSLHTFMHLTSRAARVWTVEVPIWSPELLTQSVNKSDLINQQLATTVHILQAGIETVKGEQSHGQTPHSATRRLT